MNLETGFNSDLNSRYNLFVCGVVGGKNTKVAFEIFWGGIIQSLDGRATPFTFLSLY